MRKTIALLLVFALMFSILPSGIKADSIIQNDIQQSENETSSILKSVKKYDSYLIEYKDEKARMYGMGQIGKLGGKVIAEYKMLNVISAYLDSVAANQLRKEPNITCIEYDEKVVLAGEDIKLAESEKINLQPVQETKVSDKKIKVAIFDTGVSPNKNLSINGGISFIEGVTDYKDDNGHGTLVAGALKSLVKEKSTEIGVPEPDLYSVKVLKADGTGKYSSIISGLEWAIDNDIDIINMSFSGETDSSILEKALQIAYDNNILIFASAGNKGEVHSDTITYPAKYKQVIAVGAVDKSEKRASFSSVGPDLELMAPGVDVESMSSDGNYKTMSGTSMASPYAAGVAALIWSKDISIKNDKIRSLIRYSSIGYGNNNKYGSGLVSLKNTLDMYDSYLNPPKDVKEKSNKSQKIWTENVIVRTDNNFDNKNMQTIETTTTGQQVVMSSVDFIVEDYICESLHPYENNTYQTWNIYKPGALSIRVFFSYIDTESNYDTVSTSAGDNWSGYYSEQWSSWSSGSSITVTLETDSSVTRNGFLIEKIEYTVDSTNPPTVIDDYGNDRSTATTIYPGSSLSGSINYGNDLDYFRVTPTVTGSYTIYTSGSTDTYGFLYDYYGNILAQNDDTDGRNFSITYYLTAYETYYICVKHYSTTGTGYYTLFVSGAPSTTPTNDDYGNDRSTAANILIGSPVSGNIDYGGDLDFFRIQPTVSGTYVIGTSGTTDTYGILYDSNGNILALNDDSNGTNFSITYTLSQYQTYYICVHHYSNTGLGSYILTVVLTGQTEPPPSQQDDYGNSFSTAGTISIGSPVSGSINYEGDVDFFRFTPLSSGTYTIYTTSVATDTYGTLYNSYATKLAENDDYGGHNFSITYNLTGGQTYYVSVRHYSETGTGPYVLNISLGSDTTPPSIPTGLNVTGKTSTSISFTWAASTDNVEVTEYWVYRVVDGTSVNIARTSPLYMDFTDTGLQPAHSYTYYVRARDAAGNMSLWSDSLTVVTLMPSPDPLTSTMRYNVPIDPALDTGANPVYYNEDNRLTITLNEPSYSNIVRMYRVEVECRSTSTGYVNRGNVYITIPSGQYYASGQLDIHFYEGGDKYTRMLVYDAIDGGLLNIIDKSTPDTAYTRSVSGYYSGELFINKAVDFYININDPATNSPNLYGNRLYTAKIEYTSDPNSNNWTEDTSSLICNANNGSSLAYVRMNLTGKVYTRVTITDIKTGREIQSGNIIAYFGNVLNLTHVGNAPAGICWAASGAMITMYLNPNVSPTGTALRNQFVFAKYGNNVDVNTPIHRDANGNIWGLGGKFVDLQNAGIDGMTGCTSTYHQNPLSFEQVKTQINRGGPIYAACYRWEEFEGKTEYFGHAVVISGFLWDNDTEKITYYDPNILTNGGIKIDYADFCTLDWTWKYSGTFK